MIRICRRGPPPGCMQARRVRQSRSMLQAGPHYTYQQYSCSMGPGPDELRGPGEGHGRNNQHYDTVQLSERLHSLYMKLNMTKGQLSERLHSLYMNPNMAKSETSIKRSKYCTRFSCNTGRVSYCVGWRPPCSTSPASSRFITFLVPLFSPFFSRNSSTIAPDLLGDPLYSNWRSREFAITPSELTPMSAPEMDGVSMRPALGRNTPAARGIPTRL